MKRPEPLVIVGFEVTAADRRAVARFLGRDDSATTEEMRAFLQVHGTRGLAQAACPIFPREVVTPFAVRESRHS